jgi:hypothetical protein
MVGSASPWLIFRRFQNLAGHKFFLRIACFFPGTGYPWRLYVCFRSEQGAGMGVQGFRELVATCFAWGTAHELDCQS